MTAIIPMFIIMAVLYGALTAALDGTAGERERGSLNPVDEPGATALVVGAPWPCHGHFVPELHPGAMADPQRHLAAMFQFGLPEVVAFLALQLPLAAGLGAVLMALAIRSKTFWSPGRQRSGHHGGGLAPMVSMLNPGGEASWYLWVPGLAQNTLMMLVLKGRP